MPDISATNTDPDGRTDGPVHDWFDLSYSNYQVTSRTLAQSMPVEWQKRWVRCLSELRAAFIHIEHPDCYEVTPAREVEYGELTEAEAKALGITQPVHPDGDDEDADLPDVYYDRDGIEHQSWMRALVPMSADPIPHYNRGRTYVAPLITPDGGEAFDDAREPHPVVAVVLADTPTGPDYEVIVDWREDREASEQAGESVDVPIWGDPEPIAARQAADVLRWVARDWDGDGCKCWRCVLDLADEIDPPKETQ